MPQQPPKGGQAPAAAPAGAPLSKAAAKKAAREREEAHERARQARRKAAMYDGAGQPRDVLEPLAAFTKFERGGLALDVTFTAPDAPSWSAATAAWLFDVTKANMAGLYDAAGGEWAWKDAKKRAELCDGEARYLIVRARDGGRTPLAFLQFRFLLEGPYDVLYVYELQLTQAVQRQGLGRHLMQVAELAARKAGMQK
jgi:hypothetical protein